MATPSTSPNPSIKFDRKKPRVWRWDPNAVPPGRRSVPGRWVAWQEGPDGWVATDKLKYALDGYELRTVQREYEEASLDQFVRVYGVIGEYHRETQRLFAAGFDVVDKLQYNTSRNSTRLSVTYRRMRPLVVEHHVGPTPVAKTTCGYCHSIVAMAAQCEHCGAPLAR
jgi:hypothetical protein